MNSRPLRDFSEYKGEAKERLGQRSPQEDGTGVDPTIAINDRRQENREQKTRRYKERLCAEGSQTSNPPPRLRLVLLAGGQFTHIPALRRKM